MNKLSHSRPPTCCGKLSDPGELPSCPDVATENALEAEHRQTLAMSGRFGPLVGQLWQDLAIFWHLTTFDKLRPNLANVGPSLPPIRQIWSEQLTRLGRSMAQPGRTSRRSASRANVSGNLRRNVGQLRGNDGAGRHRGGVLRQVGQKTCRQIRRTVSCIPISGDLAESGAARPGWRPWADARGRRPQAWTRGRLGVARPRVGGPWGFEPHLRRERALPTETL